MTTRTSRGTRRTRRTASRAAGALLPLLVALPLLAACGSAPETSAPSGVDGLEIPTPSPDPKDFVDLIDNTYLPLAPGSVWKYRTTSTEGPETNVVTVTNRTRVVAGVTTTVVHDVARDGRGRIIEDTWDWYAQDTAGNVWYFGEDTTAYDDGKASTEGSWEAGVNGAQAGLAMPADPRVGDGYAQEHAPGVAEDRGEVLAVDDTVRIPFGAFQDVVRTEDTTPLEPDLVENKFYAPGVGVVMERTVQGGDERVELVAFTSG
ncbi:hypothetical protein EKO23_20920 [Nocardioides guangzhouensis]|uniref:DUF3068 domain-containing protein n=1 Tax=Nocardioides guangzhouensis TaxID=2497878 RepID=A0A4Q4Z5Y1_9ACTN|nr:hypothetical protein [Nocardioides guangzhouensis]RYP82755.1 hypothetical protein EKO23_20920 [Nocardioides guangzhouensis]